MKLVRQFMDIRYDKHKQEWDTVIAIVGESGVGKSNLALHMIEHWVTKLYGKVEPSDVKHMCLTKKQFTDDLADCKPFEITAFDEAGELSSRSSLTKFNKDIMIAYQVIRADRIFTILCLPDLFYLDRFFSASRLKALFYVYQRGRVAIFDRTKLRLILGLNYNRINKNYFVVRPTGVDSFPIYKGVMLEEYKKRKEQKTKEAREGLKSDDTGDIKNCIACKNLNDNGMTGKEIAKMFNVSQKTVWNWIRYAKDNAESNTDNKSKVDRLDNTDTKHSLDFDII
jgi:GTPase SAR1 family protein